MREIFLAKPIHSSPTLSASLVYYLPNVLQSTHAHPYHQLSFLLAGNVREETVGGRRSQEIAASGVGVKPAGFDHANRYGPNGALLLSMRVHADRFEGVDFSDWRWNEAMPSAAKAQIHATLRMAASGEGGDTVDAVHDLLALSAVFEPLPRARAPAWFDRARAALREDERMPIRAIARDCGVHPVHFSRTFARVAGHAPTVCRARARIARAVRRLIDERATVADAALSTGFADQSHLTREFRRLVGVSPGRLQRFFGA